MKNVMRVLPTMLLFAALSLQAEEPRVLTVAVFDFESNDKPIRDLGPKIATTRAIIPMTDT